VAAAGATAGTGAEAAAGAGAQHSSGCRATNQQCPLVPRAHHQAARVTALRTAGCSSSSSSGQQVMTGRTGVLRIVMGGPMVGVVIEAGVGMVTVVVSRTTGHGMAAAAAGTRIATGWAEGVTGRVTGVSAGAAQGRRSTELTSTGWGQAGMTGAAAGMATEAGAEVGAGTDGGSCGLRVRM
jgi:hypothetical protein